MRKHPTKRKEEQGRSWRKVQSDTHEEEANVQLEQQTNETETEFTPISKRASARQA